MKLPLKDKNEKINKKKKRLSKTTRLDDNTLVGCLPLPYEINEVLAHVG